MLRSRTIRVALVALLPLAFAVQALAAGSPDWVERVYAQGIYPAVLGFHASLAAHLPFSLAEWLLALLLLLLPLVAVARWRRGRRAGRGRLRLAGAGLTWGLGLVGLFYLSFLLVWGLNHRRLPVAELAGLDPRPARPSELAELCAELVDRADAMRVGRLEDESGVMRLSAGREGTLERVAAGFDAAVGATRLPLGEGPNAAPKRPLVSPLLWRLGITGIYVPFTAEAHVNATVPDPDLPFVASHEMAHQRGFAREDEASWVGQLACAHHPDADFRYSGALLMSLHAMGALLRADRSAHTALAARRSEGVRRDMEALHEWSRRAEGPPRRAARRLNDAYLRSQGDADGVRSYGRVVDLLLAERRSRLEVGASP